MIIWGTKRPTCVQHSEDTWYEVKYDTNISKNSSTRIDKHHGDQTCPFRSFKLYREGERETWQRLGPLKEDTLPESPWFFHGYVVPAIQGRFGLHKSSSFILAGPFILAGRVIHPLNHPSRECHYLKYTHIPRPPPSIVRSWRDRCTFVDGRSVRSHMKNAFPIPMDPNKPR